MSDPERRAGADSNAVNLEQCHAERRRGGVSPPAQEPRQTPEQAGNELPRAGARAMGKAFVAEVRGAARALLPEGTFLRRDRGKALFVTDAPRREPDADWTARFEAAGFRCTVENSLAHLIPDGRWLAALSGRFPTPPDHLSATLRRFDGPPPEDETLHLFAEGLKLLEGEPWNPDFDRRLRQRAAVCLRRHGGGGGLYACAVVLCLALSRQ